MADSAPTEQLKEEGTWHTVEQAAVALGLSVRTVNRHIQAGKLHSRLSDGRREVFVPQPSSPDSTESDTSEVETDLQDKRAQQVPPAQPVSTAGQSSAEPTSSNTSSVTATASSFGGHNPPPFANPATFDVESALARADNAADKAELAVNAYQNLARSIELQAQSARRGAKLAWSIVAVLAVAAGVAIWWTATTVTQAKMEADRLEREAQAAAKAADNNSAELERLRDRLSNAEQAAARAQGRAEALQQSQSRRPSTNPSDWLEGLRSAFSGQATQPDH